LQANSFTVADGALEVASNVVLSKDGIISKRRGFYQYYDPSSDTLNNLVVYQDKLLGIFSDKIGYFTDAGSLPNYTGTRTTLSGVTVAVTGTRTSRTALSNRNLYFTTDNGVLKLDAYNGSVYKSGTPQALDLRGAFYGNSGVIAAEKLVGWRVIYGRRDANDNLLLGAPSEILTLNNSKVSATYSSVIIGAGPTYTVTVTTSNPHRLTTGAVIIASGAVDTDANGTFSITVTTATAFTYVALADPGTGGLAVDYTSTRNTRLEFSIPSEITTAADGYFFRLYRSSQVVNTAASIFSDFKLIDERTLTTAEITLGAAFYDDDIDDILLGEELYTNQNSREGESQANARAPKVDDMALYKGHLLYAAATTRQLLDLNLVDVSAYADQEFIDVKVDSTIRRYMMRDGVGNQTVISTSVADVAGKITYTYAAHGFTNNDSIYISIASGSTIVPGIYYIRNKSANTFEVSTTIGGTSVGWVAEVSAEFQGVTTLSVVTAGAAWVRSSNVVTVTNVGHGLSTGMVVYVSASAGGAPDVALTTYSVTVLTADTFTFASAGADDASGNTLSFASQYPVFVFDATSSASVQLSKTARGLVKAINRDASSLVYAAYTSGIDEVPGRFSLQAKGFTGAIYIRASTTAIGAGFSPVLPISFSSGTQVYSRNDQLPHMIFSSKFSEPEAVPLINQFPVGARNKAILRILALRDSVIILKEDGVYRLSGDTVFNFSVTALDTTVNCVAASSAVVLNNQVLALTNQGVCLISESSVQIVSRKIEDVIQPILGTSTLAAQTSAFAYESERFYGLTTVLPNGTTAAVVYVYNVLNDTWVTWDTMFKQGVVGPGDTLYLATSGDVIAKERKNQTRLDFSGQNYASTVSSVAADLMSAVVVFGGGVVPEIGDILVKSNVFNRVSGVSLVSGTTYTLTFVSLTNLVAADAPVLYSVYESQIKLAPFHAGLVGRMKQFAQMQLHFHDNSVSRLVITFSGDTYGSSESTTWSSILVSNGWGNFPWGFDPWGLEDGVNIQRSTSPAPICRIYVPRFQQRGTFIQPLIVHSRAGEAINLQAMTFSVRAYNERVSR
jgi:hypothetical protein